MLRAHTCMFNFVRGNDLDGRSRVTSAPFLRPELYVTGHDNARRGFLVALTIPLPHSHRRNGAARQFYILYTGIHYVLASARICEILRYKPPPHGRPEAADRLVIYDPREHKSDNVVFYLRRRGVKTFPRPSPVLSLGFPL